MTHSDLLTTWVVSSDAQIEIEQPKCNPSYSIPGITGRNTGDRNNNVEI